MFCIQAQMKKWRKQFRGEETHPKLLCCSCGVCLVVWLFFLSATTDIGPYLPFQQPATFFQFLDAFLLPNHSFLHYSHASLPVDSPPQTSSQLLPSSMPTVAAVCGISHLVLDTQHMHTVLFEILQFQKLYIKCRK